MKNILLNKILNKLSLTVLIIMIISCEADLETLTVLVPEENISFSNSFEAKYLVDTENLNAIAQELSWNVPSFGPSSAIIRHKIIGSINEDFSSVDFESASQTTNTFNLTNSDLMKMGTILGLDNDPSTNDNQGNPNNSGTVYLRVESFVGDATAVHAVKKVSTSASMNIEIIEVSTCGEMVISQWGFVGPFNDWDVTTPVIYAFLTTNTENVFVGALSVDDQGFKITVRDGSWSEGYAYGGSNGILVKDSGFDPVIPTESGHYLVTIDLSSLTYTLKAASLYGLVGPATVNGWNAPDYKFVPDECKYNPGVYIARNVPLLADIFYIRVNDDWTVSYSLGDGGEGTFKVNPGIGAQGIPVSEAGNYDIILNMNDFTYQLVKL